MMLINLIGFLLILPVCSHTHTHTLTATQLDLSYLSLSPPHLVSSILLFFQCVYVYVCHAVLLFFSLSSLVAD